MKDERIEAVVFDMDGVLFDTERMLIEAWFTVAKEKGLEDIHDLVYSCIGLNRKDSEVLFYQKYPSGVSYEKFREGTGAIFYDRVEKEGLPVMPGVIEILDFLQENKIKIGLASSTKEAVVKSHLQRSGLSSYFSVIMGGDMVEHSKPDPEIYQRACEALGVKTEAAIAIEDSYNGIRSAAAAGMKAVMVPDTVQPNEEIRELLHWECKSLCEVKQQIEKEIE